VVGLEDSTHPTPTVRNPCDNRANPNRKRGTNEREISCLRFGLVWAESALVCNPIVKRSSPSLSAFSAFSAVNNLGKCEQVRRPASATLKRPVRFLSKTSNPLNPVE